MRSVQDDERAGLPVPRDYEQDDTNYEDDDIVDYDDDHNCAVDRDEESGWLWLFVMGVWCLGLLTLSVLCFLSILWLLMWIFGR